MNQEDKVCVVRCKDCAHYIEVLPDSAGLSGVGKCEYFSEHGVVGNHFCSLGKRRDGE